MKQLPTHTIALVPLLMMAALTACERSPTSPRREAAEPRFEDDSGPLYSDQWVREVAIHGVHLGMNLSDAAARLQADAVLSEKQLDPRDNNRPWARRYIATEFRSHPEAAGDLAKEIKGDNARNHVIELYATNVNGREVVTGVSFRFSGRLAPLPELDKPTTRFSDMAGGLSSTTAVYAGDPGLTDMKYLNFLDSCNGKESGSYGDSWNCDLRGLPKRPFLYVSHYSNGVGFVVIRDAVVGRAHINNARDN